MWGQDGLVSALRTRLPCSNVTLVDFAVLPLREQVGVARDTDVLVSILGAGLTHGLWLGPRAAVVETKPPLSEAGWAR